jgi:hypothetical protein
MRSASIDARPSVGRGGGEARGQLEDGRCRPLFAAIMATRAALAYLPVIIPAFLV